MKYLLAGLGNPKNKYHFTRHNAGADAVALALAGAAWRVKDLYLYFDDKTDTTEIIYILPETFMNESGLAIKKASKDFKVPPAQIIVVHDDADLPLGQSKLSFGVSSAGHHGIDSIIKHLGTKDFWRLRYGLGRPDIPMELADYVLRSWLPNEKEILVDFASDLSTETKNLKTGRFFNTHLTSDKK